MVKWPLLHPHCSNTAQKFTFQGFRRKIWSFWSLNLQLSGFFWSYFIFVRSVLGWTSVPTCLSSFHPSFICKTGSAGERGWRLGQVPQNCRGKAIKHGFFSKTFTYAACAPNWANRSKGVFYTVRVHPSSVRGTVFNDTCLHTLILIHQVMKEVCWSLFCCARLSFQIPSVSSWMKLLQLFPFLTQQTIKAL